MLQPKPVIYPDSDGQPVAESPEHIETMTELIATIRHHLSDPETWYVLGNQLFYYVEGDPSKSFSPDVYVIRGMPQRTKRSSWKVWEDPCVPALVIELTSRSSIRYDVEDKRDLYERLGVEEYVVFDVLRDAGRAPIRRWIREEGRFVEQFELISQVLGVGLRAEGHRLRLVTREGNPVLNPIEQAIRAREEIAELKQRGADAQSEIVRLRAEIERLREG